MQKKEILLSPYNKGKEKKRRKRNCTIFHFDISSVSFVCLYMFSLTHSSSAQLDFIQLSGLCSSDKIILSKWNSKHIKILRLISTFFLQFIDCITWVNSKLHPEISQASYCCEFHPALFSYLCLYQFFFHSVLSDWRVNIFAPYSLNSNKADLNKIS